MAEPSRSRVTITLGRSGQVVKKARPVADDSSFLDSQLSVGSKRSVRDRLGSNLDSTAQFSSKRQRQDDGRSRISTSNYGDDMSLTKDDLRFKIMRKNILNKSQNSSQQKGADLRDLLSRPAQSSTTSSGTRHMLEMKNTRDQYSGPRDHRQQMPDPRNARQLMTESRNGRQLMTEPRNGRQYLQEPRDGRRLMPELRDSRLIRPGSNGASISGKIPSTRSTDALPHMDSLRHSYSPWTLDSLRRRSPDKVLGTSRGRSPPRRIEEQERRPLLRAYDDSRATSYMSKYDFGHSRSPNSASYGAKTTQTAGAAKSKAPLVAPLPASVSLVPKGSYAVDDLYTVDSLLHSLGLDKYAINFKAEEVDMYTLRQMGDNDLKELGIPMGPRKKILSLLSRSKW